MPGALLGLSGVFIILMTDEIFWRFKILRGEPSRGLVHILVGTFIAFWPFFMSMRAIQVIAALMLVVIAISRRYRIFQGIHAVKRRTYGEFFFPISVGICALVTQSDLIFMAAILHLSLADGLASLLGTRFGGKTKYRIFGQNKSWIGTGAFYLISLLIMVYVGIVHVDLFLHANVWFLAALPIAATLAESVAVYGTDDLVVPILVVVALNALHVAR
jgi:dolichol kinase